MYTSPWARYNPCEPPPPAPGTHDTYVILFLGHPNMKIGCHYHQIGIDYLWDAIFKMAAIEISEITFSPTTQFLG